MTHPSTTTPPPLSFPAPVHFDSAIPRWLKLAFMLLLLALAFFVDAPIARWAWAAPRLPLTGDLSRELMHLEQYGQWVSSIILILAVALLDRAGRQKAFALALACFITFLATTLLKDLAGRGRPVIFFDPMAATLPWKNLGFLGPAFGFTPANHYRFGSFPSAHTTGAFAIATGLAWFYPRGRPLFMTLACITAAQRILHHEHFLSDALAGILLSVTLVRIVLGANLAPRLIGAMPPPARRWFSHQSAG